MSNSPAMTNRTIVQALREISNIEAASPKVVLNQQVQGSLHIAWDNPSVEAAFLAAVCQIFSRYSESYVPKDEERQDSMMVLLQQYPLAADGSEYTDILTTTQIPDFSQFLITGLIRQAEDIHYNRPRPHVPYIVEVKPLEGERWYFENMKDFEKYVHLPATQAVHQVNKQAQHAVSFGSPMDKLYAFLVVGVYFSLLEYDTKRSTAEGFIRMDEHEIRPTIKYWNERMFEGEIDRYGCMIQPNRLHPRFRKALHMAMSESREQGLLDQFHTLESIYDNPSAGFEPTAGRVAIGTRDVYDKLEEMGSDNQEQHDIAMGKYDSPTPLGPSPSPWQPASRVPPAFARPPVTPTPTPMTTRQKAIAAAATRAQTSEQTSAARTQTTTGPSQMAAEGSRAAIGGAQATTGGVQATTEGAQATAAGSGATAAGSGATAAGSNAAPGVSQLTIGDSPATPRDSQAGDTSQRGRGRNWPSGDEPRGTRSGKAVALHKNLKRGPGGTGPQGS